LVLIVPSDEWFATLPLMKRHFHASHNESTTLIYGKHSLIALFRAVQYAMDIRVRIWLAMQCATRQVGFVDS